MEKGTSTRRGHSRTFWGHRYRLPSPACTPNSPLTALHSRLLFTKRQPAKYPHFFKGGNENSDRFGDSPKATQSRICLIDLGSGRFFTDPGLHRVMKSDHGVNKTFSAFGPL